MQIDIETLPVEVESLHRIIATLHERNNFLSTENGKLLDRINVLKEQLAVLRARKIWQIV